MRRVIFAAAMLAAGVAMAADYVAKQGDDMVRLSEAPCTDAATLAQLAPEWRDKFRAAHALIGGKQFAGCWIAEPEGVYIAFSDGDEARVSYQAFRREAGI